MTSSRHTALQLLRRRALADAAEAPTPPHLITGPPHVTVHQPLACASSADAPDGRVHNGGSR